MSPIFPVAFASDEVRLLTAIGLGFLFGFALERGGFGNARKLAAQFYLYDMTVFKVMFTAILVAMVGFYTLVGVGLVDVSMMWINPTFMWAQVVGGFLLGAGFILSGLCPGTAAVSMASGRYDGLVAFVGIFIGTALFAVIIDVFPSVGRLYETGGEVSVLPAVLQLPNPVVILSVIVMAAGGFVGAEKVEQIFRAKYGMIELTPKPTRKTPRLKFAVAGSLAAVVLVSLAWKAPEPDRSPIPMSAIEPLDLAEAMIARDPTLVILDLRGDRDEPGIPGGYAVDDSSAAGLLAAAAPTTRVVAFDEEGARVEATGEWPRGLTYEYVRGGLAAWKAEVLAPVEMTSYGVADRERAARQHQIAGFFSGAAVSSLVQAPPALPAGGAPKGKKRAGGC